SGSLITALEFPDTSVGSNSEPMTVTVRNTGDAELVFGEPAIAVPAPFSVDMATCSGTLEPEASCLVDVVFSPAAAEALSGGGYAMMVNAAAGEGWSLSLVGIGSMAGVEQVVAGDDFTFVKRTDGTWAAAGNNFQGQLGLGDTSSRKSFTTVSALNGATQVVA